jgi:hypothetical protein
MNLFAMFDVETDPDTRVYALFPLCYLLAGLPLANLLLAKGGALSVFSLLALATVLTAKCLLTKWRDPASFGALTLGFLGLFLFTVV